MHYITHNVVQRSYCIVKRGKSDERLCQYTTTFNDLDMPDERSYRPNNLRKALGSLFGKKRSGLAAPEGLFEPVKSPCIGPDTSPKTLPASQFIRTTGGVLHDVPRTPSLTWSASSASDLRLSSITIPSTLHSEREEDDELTIFGFDHERIHDPLHDLDATREHATIGEESSAASISEDEDILSDSFQESRNKMMRAFRSALANNTGSKLGHSTIIPTDFKPVQLECSAALTSSDTTIAIVEPPAAALVFTGPGVLRPRSRSMIENYGRITQMTTDHGQYAQKPLPPVPSWNGYYRYTGERNRPKTNRRTLLQQRRKFPALRRRGSCPDDQSPVASTETGSATIEDSLELSADPIVGGVLILYWMSNNRRFLDTECHELLQKSDAACLGIELGAYGFQSIYPSAKLEVYRSDVTTGIPVQGRYTQLPYPDASFDVITARAACSIVPMVEWPATLKEFQRLLKPGGKLELVCIDQWINKGPITGGFQDRIDAAVTQKGLSKDLSLDLLPLVDNCDFTRVDVAHLAMPINWGGRFAQVWRRYCEPLRLAREQSTVRWGPTETPKLRWQAMEKELKALRSARGLCVISAMK